MTRSSRFTGTKRPKRTTAHRVAMDLPVLKSSGQKQEICRSGVLAQVEAVTVLIRADEVIKYAAPTLGGLHCSSSSVSRASGPANPSGYQPSFGLHRLRYSGCTWLTSTPAETHAMIIRNVVSMTVYWLGPPAQSSRSQERRLQSVTARAYPATPNCAHRAAHAV